jgi:hypothetical protein
MVFDIPESFQIPNYNFQIPIPPAPSPLPIGERERVRGIQGLGFSA